MTHLRHKHEANICPTTGKVGFSASAASKRVNKFNDIVRYYDCPDCGLAHLTSETLAQTIGRHILDPEEENKLLSQENTELKRKLSYLSKLASQKDQKISRCKKQLNYVLKLFETENCFTLEERTSIKEKLNKI